MSYMFEGSHVNQDISGWTTSNVNSMYFMFTNNTTFTYSIANWDVSNVNNMGYMFYQSNFNQDISNWNTHNLAYTEYMFSQTNFNQNISNWDTSNLYYAVGMFENDYSFNHDISGWTISNVQNIGGFMAGLTAYSYLDNIYEKWSLQPVFSNLNIDFGSITYSIAGSAGKSILVNGDGWSISDGGMV